MKKIMTVLLSMTIVLTFCACGNEQTMVEPSRSAEVVQNTKEISGKSEEASLPLSDQELYEYEETDGKITITKYLGEDKDVTIPDTLDGKPVAVIGTGAFQGRKVERVVIPEGVTTIGSDAFCNNVLTEITIPESVTEFGYSKYNSTPFSGTPWLENKREEDPLVIVNNVVLDGGKCTGDVVIPEGVTKIHTAAFAWNMSITGVTFPESLEEIGSSAFGSCHHISEIVLPENLSYIGGYAFDGCESLESVTFPDKLIEFGTNVFGGAEDNSSTPWICNRRKENPLVIVNGTLVDACTCTGDVVIPDDVKAIAAGAFYDSPHSSGVTSVTIPDGITKIDSRLFCNCLNLTSVTIPDSVTEIGYAAFYNCWNLGDLQFPDGIESVGEKAFWFCSNVKVTFRGEVYDYDHIEELPGTVIPED